MMRCVFCHHPVARGGDRHSGIGRDGKPIQGRPIGCSISRVVQAALGRPRRDRVKVSNIKVPTAMSSEDRTDLERIKDNIQRLNAMYAGR